jgi:hypothetical protein
VIAALCATGATVELQPAGVAGHARRTSVVKAYHEGHPAILYVDLDRWLHWLMTYPDELRGLPARIATESSEAWYVCLGRTPRAFATHPEVQRVAERATSRAFELVIGREIDATAGGCCLTADAAELVANHSTEATMGTDLEWPALVWKQDPRRLATLAVEGLEFETAAFAGEAITAAGGRDAWDAQTYQTPTMWRQRLQLAADSVAALERVLTG